MNKVLTHLDRLRCAKELLGEGNRAEEFPVLKDVLIYFRWSFVVTILGLVLAGVLGYVLQGGTPGAVTFLLIGSEIGRAHV